MGFEYKIRFAVPPNFSLDSVARRLPAPAEPHEYDVTIEDDGILFVDSRKSALASLAFRQLVDEALRHSRQVVIEEL